MPLNVMEVTSSMGTELNTALTTNLTPSSILSKFLSVLPWVAGMVGAAFLIYEARKLIIGASKGKVRV